jgi:methionyl-tRNA formyltransferase
MRVAFAGTPEFAATALRALLDAGFSVPLVLTQPDRPAGRGLKTLPSAVKQVAIEHQLPLAQPRSLRLDGRFPDDAAAAQDAIGAAAADVMVVAAYGLILPAWVLQTPRSGCVNIHASLLPRWRGAAPVQRAIEAGDTQTGITLMQMDEGLDTGPVITTRSTAIDASDTAASLLARLGAIGAEAIVAALRQTPPAWPSTPQPEHGACYAAKIDKREAAIDWAADAAQIERRVRAFDPAPGCSFVIHGETVKLWRARVAEGLPAGPAGEIAVAQRSLIVACGRGHLELLDVQRAGGRRIAAAVFLAARPDLRPGIRLTAAA